MRLPFPERIPLFYVFIFAALLCTAQLLEGTAALFSLLSFLFIFISAITFNLAGGVTRPSGSYILAFSLLGVIIGLIWKAVLGEPANSNLEVPILTMEVYVGAICAMLAAVYISRKLTTKRALLGTLLKPAKEQNATMGCIIAGLAIIALDIALPHGTGSLLSGLQQVNRFLPIGIILGVKHRIKKSGGTQSIDTPILIAIATLFIIGLLGFTKEGMLEPLLCWFVTACSMRYRVSGFQILFGVLVIVFFFRYLVPYSQYGRNFITESPSENFATSVSLLSNLEDTRSQYLQNSQEESEEGIAEYFDKPQGFFDRLEMISIDDQLNNLTNNGHIFGLYPVWADFENTVPHFIWKNKPRIYWQTMFAQEIGDLLPVEDTTTGISFTPAAVGFHLAGWTGVLIVAPILWIMLFTVFDSLCGDVRQAPWGLLVIPLFAHAAPEAGFDGLIYLLGFGSFSIIVVAIAAAYLMPVIGTFALGPESTLLDRASSVRSIPRRLPSVRSRESSI
jgi:hypothetical protein